MTDAPPDDAPITPDMMAHALEAVARRARTTAMQILSPALRPFYDSDAAATAGSILTLTGSFVDLVLAASPTHGRRMIDHFSGHVPLQGHEIIVVSRAFEAEARATAIALYGPEPAEPPV